MNSDWEEVALGDVLTLQRGIDLPVQDRKPGNIPVVASNGIVGFHSKAPVKGPGVVIGRSGSIGGGQYIKEDFWPLNTTLWVKDFKGNDPRFCFYLLFSMDFSSLNAGSGVPTLNRNHLHPIHVKKPPVSSQKKISQVLGSIDDKIAINCKINQTLEAIAQAIFKSWFVDFDPVKAKIAAKAEGRDPLRAAMCAISGKMDDALNSLPHEKFNQLVSTANLFPEEMVFSTLDEIPKGYIVSKVEFLLTRLPAKKRYTKNQVLDYGLTPVFEQGSSIILGYHNSKASYHASAEKPLFIFGDHTCIMHLACQPFDISQNVIPLRGRDRNTIWVYYAIKEKQKFQEYRRHWMELISKDVAIASKSACDEFAMRITIIHLLIEANKKQARELVALRDILLPKLLSGELSVLELNDL